jgi:hypothetical protein
MAASGKPDPAAPPQPPSAAKGVFMRRIFPFFLATNVFIGGEGEKHTSIDLTVATVYSTPFVAM